MIGHNSEQTDRLAKICERIEQEKEQAAIHSDNVKHIRKEAKALGFDLGMINEMLKLRKMDADDRREKEALRDLYKDFLDL